MVWLSRCGRNPSDSYHLIQTYWKEIPFGVWVKTPSLLFENYLSIRSIKDHLVRILYHRGEGKTRSLYSTHEHAKYIDSYLEFRLITRFVIRGLLLFSALLFTVPSLENPLLSDTHFFFLLLPFFFPVSHTESPCTPPEPPWGGRTYSKSSARDCPPLRGIVS